MSTRTRSSLREYFEILRVVPGCFPVATSKPVISLMILLLPEFGLPVKTKYFSDILAVI
jgi:hypothetical protein